MNADSDAIIFESKVTEHYYVVFYVFFYVGLKVNESIRQQSYGLIKLNAFFKKDTA